jgi:uncharacterized damage-inducible protein DinB
MKAVAKYNLMQLKEMLQIITEENYIHKSDVLSGSSIGQHIRHVLEFYLLMIAGSQSGTISYDKRQRDIRIENNPLFAIGVIDTLLHKIDALDTDLPVFLETDFTADGSSLNLIQTSVGRELAYCIEHSIHHQAIIKAGLIVLGAGELTGSNFGIAWSTIRHREN